MFARDTNPYDSPTHQTMTLDEVSFIVQLEPLDTVRNIYTWMLNPPSDLSDNKSVYHDGTKFTVKTKDGTETMSYDDIKEAIHANFNTVVCNTVDFLRPNDAHVIDMKDPVMSEQQVHNIEAALSYHNNKLHANIIKKIIRSAAPIL